MAAILLKPEAVPKTFAGTISFTKPNDRDCTEAEKPINTKPKPTKIGLKCDAFSNKIVPIKPKTKHKIKGLQRLLILSDHQPTSGLPIPKPIQNKLHQFPAVVLVQPYTFIR